MICNQCGTMTEANIGFCPSCGATLQGTPTSDWNGAPSSRDTSPVSAPVAAASASALLPVCNRRGAVRGSLPWIALLAVCVTVGTAVQRTRHLVSRSIFQEAPADAGATATPPVSPVAAAAPAPVAPQNTLSRLMKITDVAELVRQPEVADALKGLLGTDLEEFERNLSVTGSPILVGDTITFTTCAPQACGVAEAAVSLATDTGTMIAAILANNHIRIYGAKSNKLEDCPTALQAWAKKLAGGSAGDFTYEMRTGEAAAGSPAPPAQQ